MGNVTGSITASGTAVTSSGGNVTLTSDAITKTKVEAVQYDHALSSVNREEFTIPSPGGSFTFKLKAPTLPNAKWYHLGSWAVLNYLGETSAATVTFSQQPASINEGSEGTFEITTTGLEKGSSLQWVLVHVGTISKASHYDATSTYGLSGAVTLDTSTSPKGTFKIKPLADETTTPTGQQKQFKIEIKRNGVVLATSNTITVNDTSKGPTYSLSLSPTTVNEGGTVTGTVTTTNPRAAGETIYWGLWDIPTEYQSSLSSYFDTFGGIALAPVTGAGTFTINVKEDNLDNPVPKTFKIMLYAGGGVELLASAAGPVTVNDTSKTPGVSSVVASGGGALTAGNLDGVSIYGTATYLGQDAGVGLSLMPDGSWVARETNGTKHTGNWFSPTTLLIGCYYYVRITANVINSVGRTSYEGATDWTPLNGSVGIYAAAETYQCVDPLTPVLIHEDGTTKPAGELTVGDQVYTMHEYTKMWGYYTITSHKEVIEPKVVVTFTDNTTLTASSSHKVYMGRDIWMQLFNLTPSQCVVSHSGVLKEIQSIEHIDSGPVISMEIENAHTYVANDIISHNIKAASFGGYYAEIDVQFTIEFSNQPGGGGSSSKTCTVYLGGTVGIPL
jgi:hypothetical protein